jgi:hypothetical protein
MALNISRLETTKVVDPRLQLDKQKVYAVVRGPRVNNYTSFEVSGVSNSGLSSTVCNPSNKTTIVSRVAYKRVQFRIVVSGTNTSGGPLLNDGYFGPRANPLMKVTGTEEVSINNDSLNISSTNEWFGALYEHYRLSDVDKTHKMSPYMIDQFQQYSEGINTNRNPLSNEYGNSGAGTDEPRASFPQFFVEPQAPNNTEAVIHLTVTEPIYVSPFVTNSKNCDYYSALSGISTLQYQCTFNKLERVMSIVRDQGLPAQINIESTVVEVLNAQLLFNFLTPPDDLVIPRSLQYSYFNVESLPTSSNIVVQPSEKISLVMNNIQLSGIPKAMYIFARREPREDTVYTSDTFLAFDTDVKPLNVNWNNQTYLSTASAQDLFHMSKKNGLDVSWQQWSDKMGSVLCVNFGTDIGLNEDESSGSVGNYNLRVEGQFKNTSNENITAKFYVVVVYDGVFNIFDGSASHNNGVLTRQDVLASQDTGMSFADADDFYSGGNFFQTLGNLFKRARPYLVEAGKKANQFMRESKILSKTLQQHPNPYAQAIGTAASMLGYGEGEEGDYYGGKLQMQIENKQYKKNKKNNKIDLSKI